MKKAYWVVIAVLTMLPLAVRAAEPVLMPVRIDGPVHDPKNHTYWFGPFCECVSVADVNGDGKLDLISGRNWYEAPDWKKHKDFRDGAETNGPETDDNSEFAMDVNNDGRPDVVSSGWMRMKGAFWYENPGPEGLKAGVKWKARRIHSAWNMEGVIHGNIMGHGDVDILCNHWAPVKGQGLTWLEHIDREPWFVEHVIGTDGEQHGNGLGDLNGDGRTDIVTPTGWYEAPPDPAHGKWVFHADYLVHRVGKPKEYIPASHPILVHDVDGDGFADIIVSAPYFDSGKVSDTGAVYIMKGRKIMPYMQNARDAWATIYGEPVENGLGELVGVSFGNGLKFLGDLNRDGYGDFSVPLQKSAVYIFLGSPSLEGKSDASASASLVIGTSIESSLGGAIPLGDINGDGSADFLIRYLYTYEDVALCIFLGGSYLEDKIAEGEVDVTSADIILTGFGPNTSAPIARIRR